MASSVDTDTVTMTRRELDLIMDEKDNWQLQCELVGPSRSVPNDISDPLESVLPKTIDRPAWNALVAFVMLSSTDLDHDMTPALMIGSEPPVPIRLTWEEVTTLNTVISRLYGSGGVTILVYQAPGYATSGWNREPEVVSCDEYSPCSGLNVMVKVIQYNRISGQDQQVVGKRVRFAHHTRENVISAGLALREQLTHEQYSAVRTRTQPSTTTPARASRTDRTRTSAYYTQPGSDRHSRRGPSPVMLWMAGVQP